MDTYGLIGKSLAHSFSKDYFDEKFRREKINGRYELFELATIEDFPALIHANPEIKGLNVTLPYKQQIIRFLDQIDHIAKIIGAVNTIAIHRKNGVITTKGYNTDAAGFEKLLTTAVPKKTSASALILGNGGAARAVRYVLRSKGIIFKTVCRSGLKADQLTYPMITRSVMESYKLIINTTPVGMYPNINDAPDIPYEYITKDHILIDLIYNPIETVFLRLGKKNQAHTENGTIMLIRQAEKAWTLWNK